MIGKLLLLALAAMAFANDDNISPDFVLTEDDLKVDFEAPPKTMRQLVDEKMAMMMLNRQDNDTEPANFTLYLGAMVHRGQAYRIEYLPSLDITPLSLIMRVIYSGLITGSMRGKQAIGIAGPLYPAVGNTLVPFIIISEKGISSREVEFRIRFVANSFGQRLGEMGVIEINPDDIVEPLNVNKCMPEKQPMVVEEDILDPTDEDDFSDNAFQPGDEKKMTRAQLEQEIQNHGGLHPHPDEPEIQFFVGTYVHVGHQFRLDYLNDDSLLNLAVRIINALLLSTSIQPVPAIGIPVDLSFHRGHTRVVYFMIVILPSPVPQEFVARVIRRRVPKYARTFGQRFAGHIVIPIQPE